MKRVSCQVGIRHFSIASGTAGNAGPLLTVCRVKLFAGTENHIDCGLASDLRNEVSPALGKRAAADLDTLAMRGYWTGREAALQSKARRQTCLQKWARGQHKSQTRDTSAFFAYGSSTFEFRLLLHRR
jgi:hypothetical protein